MIVAASPAWYLARGTGVVSLLLLTATLVVGVATSPDVNVSTGAGCSGSSPPAGVSSIQRTTDPSLYVCSVLNSSDSASGSPTETLNAWKSPGAISPPLQVTLFTASVTEPSSVWIGSVTFIVSTFAVHPAIGSTNASAMG